MPWIQLFLNFSLLLALLISPCILLMAYWYRKQLPKTVMVWRKPEMVIVTITFLIAALILFIVGISSFFSFMDLGGIQPESHDVPPARLRDIGFTCMLLLVSLGLTYVSVRLLLVRVITDRGIVSNDRLLRVPDFRNIIEWDSITDYYLVSDYPNVIFTLIIRKDDSRFERSSVRVPVYLREEFEDLLEFHLFHASSSQHADISPQRFSEN